MADEGFREYHEEQMNAVRLASDARVAAGELRGTGGGTTVASGVVLGLAAIAAAITAQTLGLRHAAFRAETPARWRE
jgi:hypothetical protein